MLQTKFKNENEQWAQTPKVWSFELWFLCTACLLNEIYLPMKIHVGDLHSFQVMFRTKFKYENQQRAITPKVWCLELWFLCTALPLNKIYLPMSSSSQYTKCSLITFWVMLQTKFKNENEQRAITAKVWSFKLCFLCTDLLLNEIYLPMKFNVDALHSFKVMLRTKKGRTNGLTDWRTDESITLCHPSRRIKKDICTGFLQENATVDQYFTQYTLKKLVCHVWWALRATS